MFGGGHSERLPEAGLVWLIGTDRLTRYPRAFAKHSRVWLKRMMDREVLLYKYVDESNHSAVRWLRWLGFSFTRRFDNFRGSGRSFWEFRIERR